MIFYENDNVKLSRKGRPMLSYTTKVMKIKRADKILLIYTGGTIGMGKNPYTGTLEPLDFKHLENAMPEMALVKTGIDVYQFTSPIDSSDMDHRIWAQLVRIISTRYNDYDGFVILHGTDTMAYTASALSFMLENLTKPVILTGSQLSMGELRTDGRENVLTSIEIASAHHENGTPIVPEVCIYFNGKLLRGNRSTKHNAEGFNAFESYNYPHLGEAGVNINYHEKEILKPDFTKNMIPHVAMDPHVIIFSLFPGLQEDIFLHLLESKDLRAIVMRSFGSGNAPQNQWLTRILNEAALRGIVIVSISQCEQGSVEMNRYKTGYQLQETGVLGGYDCTVEAAVTKLMFLEASFNDYHLVRTYMARSLAGEISI